MAAVQSPAGATWLATFQKTLVYDQDAPVDRLLADIGTIRNIGDTSASAKRRWRIIAIAVLLLGLLLFFAGARAGSRGALLVVLGMVAIVASVVLFVVAKRSGRLDVEHRRYELLARVLQLIKPDLGPSASAQVHVDLRSATVSGKLQNTRQEGTDTFKQYVDPWLLLCADFADRSRLTLGFTERTVVRTRKKKSASGKTKTKHKTKSAELASLSLRRSRQAGALPGDLDLKSSVVLPAGATLRDVTVKDRVARLKVRAAGDWLPQPKPGGESQLDAGELVSSMLQSAKRIVTTPGVPAG